LISSISSQGGNSWRCAPTAIHCKHPDSVYMSC
jgi:hypothetical protein